MRARGWILLGGAALLGLVLLGPWGAGEERGSRGLGVLPSAGAPESREEAPPSTLADPGGPLRRTVFGGPPPSTSQRVAPARFEPAPAEPEELEPPPPAPPPPNDALLVVRLVAAETGAPLEGLGVYLADSGSSPWTPTSSGRLGDLLTTDEDGRVEFAVPSGLELEILHDRSFAVWEDESVPPLHAGERREVLLELPDEAQAFWVQVVGAEDGVPIPGAEVLGRQQVFHEPPIQPARPEVVVSDEDGRARLAVRTWEPLHGEVRAPGRAPLLFVFEEGHASAADALVLRVPAAAGLRGIVLEAGGEPAAGVEVRLTVAADELRGGIWNVSEGLLGFGAIGGERRWSATTASDGSFALHGLPAAPLTAEVLRAGALVRREAEPLVLAPGEARAVRWTIDAGCTLAGTVVDQHGEPVPGAALQVMVGAVEGLYHEERPVHARASADGAGRFLFEGLPPGTWSLGPEPPSMWDIFPAEPLEQALAPLALVLELAPGEERELVLEVFRGIQVRGRVVDPDGRPPPGDVVSVTGILEDGSVAMAFAERGVFALGPLAPGPLVLCTGDVPGFGPALPLKVQAGDEGVVLRLQRLGELGGTVVDAASEAPVAARVELFSRGPVGVSESVETGADGSFRFHGVPPGPYDLCAVTDDGRIGPLRFDLPEGLGSSDLVIEVTPGARLCITSPDPPVNFTVLWEGAVVGFAALARADDEHCLTVPAGTVLVEAGFFTGTLADLESGTGVILELQRTVTLAAGERGQLVLTRD